MNVRRLVLFVPVLDRRYRRRVEASSASDTRSLATQEARP